MTSGRLEILHRREMVHGVVFDSAQKTSPKRTTPLSPNQHYGACMEFSFNGRGLFSDSDSLGRLLGALVGIDVVHEARTQACSHSFSKDTMETFYAFSPGF